MKQIYQKEKNIMNEQIFNLYLKKMKLIKTLLHLHLNFIMSSQITLILEF